MAIDGPAAPVATLAALRANPLVLADAGAVAGHAGGPPNLVLADAGAVAVHAGVPLNLVLADAGAVAGHAGVPVHRVLAEATATADGLMPALHVDAVSHERGVLVRQLHERGVLVRQLLGAGSGRGLGRDQEHHAVDDVGEDAAAVGDRPSSRHLIEGSPQAGIHRGVVGREDDCAARKFHHVRDRAQPHAVLEKPRWHRELAVPERLAGGLPVHQVADDSDARAVAVERCTPDGVKSERCPRTSTNQNSTQNGL